VDKALAYPPNSLKIWWIRFALSTLQSWRLLKELPEDIVKTVDSKIGDKIDGF